MPGLARLLLDFVRVGHLVDGLFDLVVDVTHAADPRPIHFLHDVAPDRCVVLLAVRAAQTMTFHRLILRKLVQLVNFNPSRLYAPA